MLSAATQIMPSRCVGFNLSGWIPCSLLRRICSFTEVRHSRMLLAGIQAMSGLTPARDMRGDDPSGFG